MELIGHMKSNCIVLLSGVFLLTAACSKEVKKPTEKNVVEATEVRKVEVPTFNADSAYAYIQRQVAFGPRVPNTSAHKKCGQYLVDFFNAHGSWTYKQEFTAKAFDGTQLQLKNIIASYNTKAAKRVIVAAHWDSRPFADQDSIHPNRPIDGANDGASGVGVIMELARSLHTAKIPPDIGVDLILFDGEDYGEPSFHEGTRYATSWCLGSQYWSDRKHIGSYKAYYGILLDMVGAKDAQFAKEGTSMKYAPSVVERVWSTAGRLGYSMYFVNKLSPEIIDDHHFVNENGHIPMIDIIQYAPETGGYFGAYWHTHQDAIQVIDKNTLKAVGQTVLEVLYQELP